jgi:hypothetical protein
MGHPPAEQRAKEIAPLSLEKSTAVYFFGAVLTNR